jgi:hypothetical protein
MAETTVKKKSGAVKALRSKITSDDRTAGAWLTTIAVRKGGTLHSATLWGALPEYKALCKTATPSLWGALLTGAFAMHDESGWATPSQWARAIGVTSKTLNLIDKYQVPSLVELVSKQEVSLTQAQHAVYTLALAKWLAGKDEDKFESLTGHVVVWAKSNPGRNTRELNALFKVVEHSYRHKAFSKQLKALCVATQSKGRAGTGT